jgi:glyoxylase-like metal-dependent hydrolase (beta-lactamase superfamily II)
MSLPAVEAHATASGARIYRLPLELFPGFWGFAHLVFAGDLAILVDVGSGFGESNGHLEAGLESVRRDHGEPAEWSRLTHIVITHGHIDHFGGLPYVRERTQAPIAIHELDLRVLTNYEQRLRIVAHRLREFLAEAGVSAGQVEEVMSLYLLNKHLFTSVPVEITFTASEDLLGPIGILHTPGHCPGQIVLRVDDILITGDHVLPETSPHQSPERLSLYTGLGHYLESLDLLHAWAEGARLGLGGHEGPIRDVRSRILEILRLHADRLNRVLELTEEPSTVSGVAAALFPGVTGYHVLLALEEAGAHVEYLATRGHLSVENLDDLETETPVPILYRRQAVRLPDRPFIGRSGTSRPAPRPASVRSAGSAVGDQAPAERQASGPRSERGIGGAEGPTKERRDVLIRTD